MSRAEDDYRDSGIAPGPAEDAGGGPPRDPRGHERPGAPWREPSEESVAAGEEAAADLPTGSDDYVTSSRLPVPLPPLDVGRVSRSVPGVARIAVVTAFNTGAWGVRAYVRLVRRLLHAAVDGEVALELARELGVTVGTVAEVSKRLAGGMPLQQAVLEVTQPAEEEPVAGSTEHRKEQMETDLRSRGQALLQRSRDVWNDDTAHPAYERILDELAPDEARILLLLHRDGPQPSVDVRTGGPIGVVNSELVAPGLTMIGARAGVRYGDFVPSYLNNLFRLGMVWFSRESLRDPMPYQVLEAQPDVLEALHSVKFTKVVRRSIHLTPFGHDFCAAVLAPDDDPHALPSHQAPTGSPAEPPRP